jgi:hypothetical protein
MVKRPARKTNNMGLASYFLYFFFISLKWYHIASGSVQDDDTWPKLGDQSSNIRCCCPKASSQRLPSQRHYSKSLEQTPCAFHLCFDQEETFIASPQLAKWSYMLNCPCSFIDLQRAKCRSDLECTHY